MAVHNTLIWLDRLDLWNIFPVILQLFHYKKELTCTFMDTKASCGISYSLDSMHGRRI